MWLPSALRSTLESIPGTANPMDVMRTGCSALGCQMPEDSDHNVDAARDIIDRLMACFGSMLVYWYHFSHHGKRIELVTDDDSIGGHFLHLLHGEPPRESWVKAMHISLILYAEHEFNASTFTGRVVAGTGSDLYSCITAAIGALRGPKHGGANEAAFETQSRYSSTDEAEAAKTQLELVAWVMSPSGSLIDQLTAGSDPRNNAGINWVTTSRDAGSDDASRTRARNLTDACVRRLGQPVGTWVSGGLTVRLEAGRVDPPRLTPGDAAVVCSWINGDLGVNAGCLTATTVA